MLYTHLYTTHRLHCPQNSSASSAPSPPSFGSSLVFVPPCALLLPVDLDLDVGPGHRSLLSWGVFKPTIEFVCRTTHTRGEQGFVKGFLPGRKDWQIASKPLRTSSTLAGRRIPTGQQHLWIARLRQGLFKQAKGASQIVSTQEQKKVMSVGFEPTPFPTSGFLRT